jgi:hypothetical protein
MRTHAAGGLHVLQRLWSKGRGGLRQLRRNSTIGLSVLQRLRR